jgi:hypothetical protein
VFHVGRGAVRLTWQVYRTPRGEPSAVIGFRLQASGFREIISSTEREDDRASVTDPVVRGEGIAVAREADS